MQNDINTLLKEAEEYLSKEELEKMKKDIAHSSSLTLEESVISAKYYAELAKKQVDYTEQEK